MTRLSLSMIVKNEEYYLRDCLESVKDVVDEIVIVDTGSEDRTLEIAKEFKANIHHFDWIDDFSAARNFALSKSTGTWILYLDADERLNPKSIKQLQNIIKTNDSLGINCTINNLDEYTKNPKLMKYTRLFKNSSSIKFSGKAHEQIEPSLKENGYQIKNSSIEIIHEGYNVPEEELMKKATRNLELLLNDFNSNPTSYLAFQIGNSYSVLQQIEESIYYYKEALKTDNLRKEFKAICYLNIADWEMRNENYELALQYVISGQKLDNEHPQLKMVGAQIYDKLGKVSDAIVCCEKALQFNKKIKHKKSNNVIDTIINDEDIIFEGIVMALRYNLPIKINYFLKELKKENKLYFEGVNAILGQKLFELNNLNNLNEIFDNNNLRKTLTILKYNNEVDAKLNFFSHLYDKFNNSPLFLKEFGLFLQSINQIDEAQVIFEQALDNTNFEESIIFYLASIYVSKNQITELKKMLNIAEKEENTTPLFATKLNLLKSKLQPILQNI